MSFSTGPALHRYLQEPSSVAAWQALSALQSVTSVTGGSTNQTFRLHFRTPLQNENDATDPKSPPLRRTAILKHFPEEIVLTPQISFHQDRQVYEARALSRIPSILGSPVPDVVQVMTPKLFHTNLQANFIVVEDLSPDGEAHGLNQRSAINCASFVSRADPDDTQLAVALNVARALGRWLCKLHSSCVPATIAQDADFDHAESRRVDALTCLSDFSRCIDRIGVSINEERRQRVQSVLDRQAAEIMVSKEALIMGDFWLGNVMVRLQPSQDGDSLGSSTDISRFKTPEIIAFVIDWEFVTYGQPYVDLAHFASELWLFNFFRSKNDEETLASHMTTALFEAYTASGGIVNIAKVILYVAGHIGCFLGYADHWTSDNTRKQEAVLKAIAMIEHVIAEDWDNLSQDRFLRPLLACSGVNFCR